ncbi:MAG: hypothetical protein WAP23_01040, partial [Candidatus Spechtbacterales bacterium]
MKKYLIILPAVLLVLGGTGYLLWAQVGTDRADYPNARDYAPNFWFDSEEKYYPADPLDFYYEENGNEISGAVAVAKYNGLSLEEKLNRAKIFYKVDDSGSEFVYQYWVFYVMNNYENGHYGDWESVFVFVDKESKNINKAVGSAHGSGHKLEIKSEGTRHVWLYVGNGSHANCPVEFKGSICDSNIWKVRESWDSEGDIFDFADLKIVFLEQPYIDKFGDATSFDKKKSPILGVNPYKVSGLNKVRIPLIDTKSEKYINPPLVGDYFGRTPTFAWAKEEYHNPQEILTPTHTKIARSIGGFFNDTGNFLAAVGRTVANPFVNLFGGNTNEANVSNVADDDSPSELTVDVGTASTPPVVTPVVILTTPAPPVIARG